LVSKIRRTTEAVYALQPFGPDGHGGYTRNGLRYSAGSTNADEQTNCHCTAAAVAGTCSPTYVQTDETANSASSTDIRRYRAIQGALADAGERICSVGKVPVGPWSHPVKATQNGGVAYPVHHLRGA
jgi:hypothetical protein